MKKIVLTGGGSAGHVTPNLALIPMLREAGWQIEYIGSESGIERQIIEDYGGIPYFPIPVGKLRRYFDLKNMKDPFNVIRGVVKAARILRKRKPSIVFSKGGFVAVPVIVGAWLNRIPLIIHESDMSPGLANKLSIPFATKICVTFPETLRYVPAAKAIHTGSPIRQAILRGSAEQGLKLCNFHQRKPILLVMGGSLGSQTINRVVWDQLDILLARFQIVHLCGKGNIDHRRDDTYGYKQFEFLGDSLADVLAMSALVVSRAGSNSIFEFLALKKPMLLIPLSKEASRGDQLLNAASFENMGYSKVLREEELDKQSFYAAVSDLNTNRQYYIDKMASSPLINTIDQIIELLEETAH